MLRLTLLAALAAFSFVAHGQTIRAQGPKPMPAKPAYSVAYDAETRLDLRGTLKHEVLKIVMNAESAGVSDEPEEEPSDENSGLRTED